jgi:hypothetical protein
MIYWFGCKCAVAIIKPIPSIVIVRIERRATIDVFEKRIYRFYMLFKLLLSLLS